MERVLMFKYPFERKKEMDKLKRIFMENNIEFICYESDGYYPHEFIVRKSKRKWDELYKIINSVYPVKYSFKKTNIEVIDGKLSEVIFK